MGFWNLYFAVKLYLYAVGDLRPIWWLNLLFALLLLVPLPKRWMRVTRLVLAIVAGTVLIYHESDLPPFSYVLRQIPGLSTFSASYMIELAHRIVTPAVIYVPIIVVLAYLLINRWVRVSTFVLVAMLGVCLWEGMDALVAKSGVQPGVAVAHANTGAAANDATGGYDQQLAAFYAAEKGRKVNFSPASSDPNAQFDIIVLHICSLSWDDLDVVNMHDNALFQRFDFVFKNFSSAASYSGPAAIRVLRAACGQQQHRDLYSPEDAGCHLFADLAAAGYGVQALLNHDGQFDDFRGLVIREIAVPGVQLESNEGLPMAMREFDGSRLVGDYDALERWYKQRLAKGGGPVALYYNTVTLHDGNRLLNSNMSSLQSYPVRMSKLVNDIDRLIDLIAQSGRKAAIVFVPEHGAALRGDSRQIAGMREIPTPRIIHVPVGVTLVGLPGHNDGTRKTVTIDTPTSYLALGQLLSKLVADSPFRDGAPPLSQYAADLPQTRMIGENENTVTMTTPDGYVIHTSDGVWVEGK
ncbi:cellulose biosynthesis protein BcsG [Dyella sp. C9]|uniref:cellulose biosynthesis protein BcsG n=1 Tax=Dyella sp. C9 TaxID=2202154 RepID=UPI000DEF2A0B|nr:cellulose biosynthesis protein BcsG [Dyella sp. C9]